MGKDENLIFSMSAVCNNLNSSRTCHTPPILPFSKSSSWHKHANIALQGPVRFGFFTKRKWPVQSQSCPKKAESPGSTYGTTSSENYITLIAVSINRAHKATRTVKMLLKKNMVQLCHHYPFTQGWLFRQSMGQEMLLGNFEKHWLFFWFPRSDSRRAYWTCLLGISS